MLCGFLGHSADGDTRRRRTPLLRCAGFCARIERAEKLSLTARRGRGSTRRRCGAAVWFRWVLDWRGSRVALVLGYEEPLILSGVPGHFEQCNPV